MDRICLEVRESMFIIDGGQCARLPEGSGGPIVAGPEAVFIAGRVAADAATVFRVGRRGGQGSLSLFYDGILATPLRVLRAAGVDVGVLAELAVPSEVVRIEVYLTDCEEPDEIFVAVSAEPLRPDAGMAG